MNPRFTMLNKVLFLFIFSGIVCCQETLAQTYTLSNSNYTVIYNEASKKIRIVNNDYQSDTIDFTPSFYVLMNSNPANPSKMKVTEDINYQTTAWNGSTDLYSAGAARIRSVQGVTQEGDKLVFSYMENTEFSLTASLELPAGTEYPLLSYCLTAKKASGFSVGYIGAPNYSAAQLDELWQPLVWTEKKFPDGAYLTPSYQCSLPSTMATYEGYTYGVIADPGAFPFAPMQTFARSEFGVALRNDQGQAQPMIWAPIMGSPVSRMNTGDSFCFSMRLFGGRKSIQEFYEELSNQLYGFEQYNRSNVLGSLNEVLENMVDYGMSDYSRFNESAKGPSYQTDIPGAVKVTSALNPLNIAYVTDNEAVFKERSMPMMEFLLSRSNTTYADEETTGTGQKAYNSLGVPAMNFSEMTALYSISKGNIPFLLEQAEEHLLDLGDQANERQWREYIALYRATGDEQYKIRAMQSADQYIVDRIDNLQSDFTYLHHSKSSFWVQLAPKFIDLMELYEISGEYRYLEAARIAAHRYAMFTWMSPKVPNKNIIVNIGGEAPVYPYVGGAPISVPEESVPAWRLSNFGLHSEAAATAVSHRSVFMAHHAPYFLKIGALTNDDYLKKIAKSAIIGRYTNFPGYHTNTDHTTVYEKEDFPLRTHDQLSSTSMHYNHVWPMMSLILDYLVSDAIGRSKGNIDFRAEFVQAFANLQSRVYGHHPGNFYHVDSVTLWMPKDLLTVDNPELNYITARKGDTLLVAFMNQASTAVSANVTINTALVGMEGSHDMELIKENGSVSQTTMSGNSFAVGVAGDGITAIVLKDVDIDPVFQDKFYTEQDTTWSKDYLKDDFASTYAMFLTFGEDLSEVFVFSAAEKETYASISLKYLLDGGDTVTISDSGYPYEFEVAIPAGSESFNFILETVDQEGNVEISDMMELSKPIKVKAEIDGEKFIQTGDSVKIPVFLEGKPPWNLEYTDGVDTFLVEEITESPYALFVKPDETSTYTLLSVSDSTKTGTVKGSTVVVVLEHVINPIFDGMVRQQQGDGIFNLDYIEVKASSAYAREGFFTFDISREISRPVENAVFKLYIYNADKDFNVALGLHGIDKGFNNKLAWDNKPADNEFTFVAENLTYDPRTIPSYLSWEVTDYLNGLISDSTTRFSFKASVPSGNDVLLKSYAVENTVFVPQLIFTQTSSVEEEEEDDNNVTGISTRKGGLVVFPNPADNKVTVTSDKVVKAIKLLDLMGNVVLSGKGEVELFNLDTSSLPSGIYILKVYLDDKVRTQKMLIKK